MKVFDTNSKSSTSNSLFGNEMFINSATTFFENNDPIPKNPLIGLKRGDGLVWGTWHLRPRVKLLQQRLNAKSAAALKIDGMFGPRTGAALETFQFVHHLPIQQNVDALTASLLSKPSEKPDDKEPPGIMPVNFTFPKIASIDVIRNSKDAFSGFPIVKGVDLNQPGKFNETTGKGRVHNIHQIAFKLSQGDPNELFLIRKVDRVARAGGKAFPKKGDDGPSAPTVVRTKKHIVVSDAPGYGGPAPGTPPHSAFPVSYIASFKLFAVDAITKKVLAKVDYVVVILKDSLSQKDPVNSIGAEKKKIKTTNTV